MNKRVWKFVLDPNNTKIVMPVGAEVLTVQSQNNEACLWALVDPDSERETRVFDVYGTGHNIRYDIGIDRKYIATFQLNDGLVFHVFERL